EMRRPRHPYCRARRTADQDCSQDRQGRSRLFRRADQAADESPVRRLYWRDQRCSETGFPQRGDRPSGVDRLAGAVRPDDDRGNGVRHPRNRIQPRLRAGGHGGWADGFHRGGQNQRGWSRWSAREPAAATSTGALRGALHSSPHGHRISGRLPRSHGTGHAAPSLGDRLVGPAKCLARRSLVAIAVVALASLPISAAWWLLSAPSTPQGKDRIALASEVPSSADRLKAPVPSVAVLPFVNLSGDAKRDYLADGITDSLI